MSIATPTWWTSRCRHQPAFTPCTPPKTIPSTTTPKHAWIDAGSLAIGDRLHTADGSTVVVTGIRMYASPRTMNDLTISDIHAYYVIAGTTPVLVHNQDPAVPPRVSDPKLQNFVNALYKGVGNPNLVGDGTAMSAANSEVTGGGLVEGRNHVTSTGQYRVGLDNWLANNPNASASDRQVAEDLVSAIDDAHAGSYKGTGGYAGLGAC